MKKPIENFPNSGSRGLDKLDQIIELFSFTDARSKSRGSSQTANRRNPEQRNRGQLFLLVLCLLSFGFHFQVDAQDVANATFFQEKDIFSDITLPRGMTFNDTGSKLFVSGQSISFQEVVYSYNLSNNYDVNTATLNASESLVLEDPGNFSIAATDLVFNPTGTILYFTGSYFDINTFDQGDSLYSVDLSSAFDVSSANLAGRTRIDISGVATFTSGIDINDDGTKISILDKASKAVYEYDLSTAYSLVGATSGGTLDVSAQMDFPESMRFNVAGSALFIVENDMGANLVKVYRYSVIDYSIATAMYTGGADDLVVDFSRVRPGGMSFNSDDTKFYLAGTDDAGAPIVEYDLAAANANSPVITASQNFSVDENAAGGTSVGTVVATDADAGTTFGSWAITNGNEDANFSINISTGEITVAAGASLDFETTTNYTLTLTVSDGMNISDPEDVTITVNDIDEVAPTIEWTSPDFASLPSHVNSNAPFTVWIVFSEEMIGFELSDIEFDITNATFGNLTSLGLQAFGNIQIDIFSVEITPNESGGDITFNIPKDIATDLAGNLNAVSETIAIKYDASPPTPEITSDVISPTNATTIPITIDFGETVNDFVQSHITIDNGTIGTLTPNGENSSFTTNITGHEEGPINLSIAAGAVSDVAGNNNNSGSLTLAHDITSPTATITADPDITNIAPIIVIIDFNEEVKEFTQDDLTIVNGSIEALTSADNQQFALTVLPEVGADSIQVQVILEVGKAQDLAGNTNDEEKSLSIIYDTKPPVASLYTLSSIEAQQPSSTGFHNGSPFTGVLTLNENTTGLLVDDLTATGATISTLVEAFGPRLLTFLVTPNGTEDIVISIPADKFTDIAGNGNVLGNTLEITYDATAPTITSVVSTVGDVTKEAQFDVTVTFSEVVNGFTLDDLETTNGSATSLNSEDNKTYTATITAATEGEVTVLVKDGSVVDLAGNALSGTGSVTVTYDTSAPTVEIQDAPTAVNSTAPFTITLQFNEEIATLAAANVQVTNGTAVTPQIGANDAVYTVAITPDGQDGVTITVKDFEDLAGNIGEQSVATVSYDTEAPVVTIQLPEGLETRETFTATFTFNESVSGFAVGDITASPEGSTIAEFTPVADTDDKKYTAEITPDASLTSGSSVVVTVAADAAADDAGNGNAQTDASVLFTQKYNGGSGTEDDPYLISSEADLRALSASSADWDKHFKQTADIEMGSDNFLRIGQIAFEDEDNGTSQSDIPFSGSYAGENFMIDGLTTEGLHPALFEFVKSDHFIKDLTLLNTNITSMNFDGVSSDNTAGGLINRLEVPSSFEISNITVGGKIHSTTDEYSFASGIVTVAVGNGTLLIENCRNYADIKGNFGAGIIASIEQAITITINQSANLGNVTAYQAGGLIYSTNGSGLLSLESSFNAGSINDLPNGLFLLHAGLVATCNGPLLIRNCYNIGAMKSISTTGGLVGGVSDGISLTIANSFNIGEVEDFDQSNAGLLVIGSANAEVSGSFWNEELSGVGTGVGTGLTTAEMRTLKPYTDAGWDFTNTWSYKHYYPLLKWQADNLKPFSVSGKVVNENGDIFTAGKVKAAAVGKPVLSTDIDAEGNFQLDIPDAGLYNLHVIPDNLSEYFITFLGNTNNFFLANYVFHDQSNLEIKMIAKSQANQLDGNGRVSGRVVSAEDGGRGRIVQGRILEGNPLEGVTVFLVRTSDEEILTSVTTDANGDFEIAGIPAGEYQLVLDVAGIDLNLEGSTFTMDEEGTPLEISAAVGEDGITFAIEEVLGVAYEISVTIYPNPVRDFINLQLEGEATLKLIDLSGMVIKEYSFTNETRVDVRSLKEGIHFIEVSSKEGRTLRKLIKTN